MKMCVISISLKGTSTTNTNALSCLHLQSKILSDVIENKDAFFPTHFQGPQVKNPGFGRRNGFTLDSARGGKATS